MKVVVLHDLVPPEARPDLLDNLVQATQVASALERLGHLAVPLAFYADADELSEALKAEAPEVVFNLVETPMGMARLIHMAPLLLARLGMAHTGADTRAMLVSSNKLLAKNLLRQAGLPTPDWVTLQYFEQRSTHKTPYLIKPAWEHGSVGMDDDAFIPQGRRSAITEALARRTAEQGPDFFAEAYVEGREFNLSILAGPAGAEVLPPAEIVFQDYEPGRLRVVGFQAKWEPESFEYRHTPRRFGFAPRDQHLLEELKGLSLRCWKLFGLRGWARVDFRVDGRGQPFILEVNANPCLSDDAGFMAAASKAGLDQSAVVARILADAHRSRPRAATLKTQTEKVAHGAN